ncbi:Squamous cell carcinoma antigen recognized by T-cells 3 [Nymphaea thermarum]|nr:Squamous cell carcinoma antigen recognized by T-cells 3 [Nymphaea thermarum]
MAENQTVDDPEFAAADHPPSFDTEEMPQGSGGGHSSSADSDSDDSEDEALDIKTLERVVQDSPNDYDAQVKYIKSLRKAGEIEKLRAARESMSAMFPLTPTMWQEWASDESSLSTSPEALTTVENIYERGVQEYLSIPLWCNYLSFIQEYNESVSKLTIDGVAKMRDLFEQALTSGGLHVAEGSKIWDAYREFEQAYHLAIDEADAEEKARQTDRIRSLFHRQLSIPLANMSSTLDEYKQWEIGQGKLDGMMTDFDSIPSNVISAYKKALEMYNSRACYEERVSGPDVLETEKFQGFMSYIKFEERSGDPARIQVLYERAITEFSVSSDLWLNYTSYVDNKLKVPNVIKAVYTRATRSCPWIGELWTRYLLSLERLGSSEEDLSIIE